MAINVGTGNVVCARCGMAYPKRDKYFHKSISTLNKGIGYLPICKDCVNALYTGYLEQCKEVKHAIRQVCRSLNLFYDDHACDLILARSDGRTAMSMYIQKLATAGYAGKSYDNTLVAENKLWDFTKKGQVDLIDDIRKDNDDETIVLDDDIEITEDIVRFWGSGQPKSMYKELEQRRRYWMSKLTDIEVDVGTEALIRQICSLELDINRDRLAGKSVEKLVNALNTLLGSANLKPTQKKDDSADSAEKTPMGVWIWRFENEKPIPEPDPELEDVDGIKRYILTWFYGHLAKMMNVKNAHSKLYDAAIEDLRVEHPEYDDVDDDDMLYDVLGGEENRYE